MSTPRYRDEDLILDTQKMQDMVKAAKPMLEAITTAPQNIRFVRHNNLPFLAVDDKELGFPMYNAWYLAPAHLNTSFASSASMTQASVFS